MTVARAMAAGLALEKAPKHRGKGFYVLFKGRVVEKQPNMPHAVAALILASLYIEILSGVA